MLRVSSPQQEVGRSDLHQLHALHCFLIRHQMPGAAVIHPGSDKHMILCGLILWEEGWNFLWVQMPQENVLSFKPGVFSWLSHVSDKWITISGLHTISAVFSSKFYCFYCEYFSFDSVGIMVDLDCGRNHSHINKE